MKRKHQEKLTNLQIDVLYTIASQGEHTPSTLTEELDKKYASIHGALEILEDKEMVPEGIRKPGRTSNIISYSITDKGLLELASNPRISMENLWKIIFSVYDKKSSYKPKITIDEIFYEYQENVLLLPTKNSPFFFEEILDHIKFYPEEKVMDFKKTMKVIKLLAHKGTHTMKQISTVLKLNHSELDDMIFFMLRRGMVARDNSKKVTKYGLSHSGLLLLIHELCKPIEDGRVEAAKTKYQDGKDSKGNVWNTSIINEYEGKELFELKKEIHLIVENCNCLLPKVFGKWKQLKQISDEVSLIQIFNGLYFQYETRTVPGFPGATIHNLPSDRLTSLPIHLGGIREIFDIQRSMEIVYRDKMNEVFSYGKIFLDKWIEQNADKKRFPIIQLLKHEKRDEILSIATKDANKQKKSNLEYTISGKMVQSNVIDVLRRIPQVIQKLAELYELTRSRIVFKQDVFVGEQPNLHDVNITERALENIISFQFYTIFSPLWKSEDGTLFLDHDKKLKEWYIEWLNQIIGFEEKNQRLLEKTREMLREQKLVV